LIIDDQDVTVVHLRLPHTMVRPRRQIDCQVPRMCLSSTLPCLVTNCYTNGCRGVAEIGRGAVMEPALCWPGGVSFQRPGERGTGSPRRRFIVAGRRVRREQLAD